MTTMVDWDAPGASRALVGEIPAGRLHEVLDAVSDRLKGDSEAAGEAGDEPVAETLGDAAMNAALACGWCRKAARQGWGRGA